MTNALATIMFASIVLRETVGIALMITTLNDLEDKSSIILNAYVDTCDRKGVDHFGS